MVKPEISSGEKIIILICQSCQNNLNKKILIQQGIFFRSAAKHAQWGLKIFDVALPKFDLSM